MAGGAEDIVWPALVPELEVSDLTASLRIYLGPLGFTLLYGRPEEGFAYLTRDGAHLMLEEIGGSGRRFSDAPMARPFGRGINLQIEIPDVDQLYQSVLAAGLEMPIPLEDKWYRQDEQEAGNRQFVIADPDGYLLRFFSDLGLRPHRA
ncbi:MULTISPECIES: VOC family protein [unclassified Acidocella]|uniref:bleomycin resistance protein n=1 Tax=unclassified Acidocella TaxID=2648610 RepID=UPI00028EB97A|nr:MULTISPECIES: VOC family protein [unclassified Acidocella]EKM98778.1 hypothetical protein MXAZACID_13888 [Acidocella sp. MX-AZ02]WBO58802.1 VOC family protein [Acidocella sp. MX-AZ03]